MNRTIQTLSALALVGGFVNASHAQDATAPTGAEAPAVDTPIATSTDAVARDRDAEIAALHEAVARLTADMDAMQTERAQASDHEAIDDAALSVLIEDAETTAMAEGFEPDLHLYGWSEFGLQKAWGGLNETGLIGSDDVAFVTRTNLYIDATPAQNMRVLTEVRFGQFPNGARDQAYGYVDTTTTDLSSPYGGLATLEWSGILLERAHADWTPSDTFNLRAGLFLTPYGIWNVDHGAPTRITLTAPTFMSFGLLPERQLGVEMFGTTPSLPWTLGYHLYVSSGRNISATSRHPGSSDTEGNKAIGGRVFARTRQPYPLTLGMSAFAGTFHVVNRQLTIRADRIESVKRELVDMTEYALTFDASADLGPLRLRSELVLHWVYYEDGKREHAGPSAFNADTLHVGAYIMAAYQLPWGGIEPFTMMEVMRMPTILGEGGVIPAAGINIYLSSHMTLRTQYSYVHLFDFSGTQRDLPQSYNHFLSARFIAAF